MTVCHRCALSLGLFVTVASTAFAQAPRAYRADDLGTLGGGYAYGAAMNANGDIAGSATTADGTLHGFRWTRGGGLEDLFVSGAQSVQASGINDRGDVVGTYLDHDWQQHNFIAPRGGVIQDLDAQIFQVSAITNAGWLAGYTWNGFAFRGLVGGTLQELTDHFSFSNAINDRGDAAGWVFPDDTGLATAFRYSDGAGFVTLGTLGGATSYGYAINGNGVIVGTADTPSGLLHAFRARPGAPMEDLGTLPGPPVSGSSATAINDAGDIVGITDAGGSLTAFRYTDAEGMVDLAPRIPIAARLRGMPYSGFAINAAGQIGFHYVDANGNLRAMLLTPVKATPPPVIVHAAAEPGALWPADGRMVSVHANVAATDEYDVAPVCRITRVTNSQHPSGPDPDVKVTGLLSVSLRASRAGRGNSRTYTIDVACTNYFGNVTTTHLFVPVLKTRNGSE